MSAQAERALFSLANEQINLNRRLWKIEQLGAYTNDIDCAKVPQARMRIRTIVKS